MSDLAWRIIILGGVLLLALVSIWRSSRTRPGTPKRVSRPDLGPGVHFFSSGTCASCADARRVLQKVYGDRFSEVRYEDDPTGFGAFDIASVPTVFVLGPDGAGTRWEGVPPRRHLKP